MTSAGPSTSEGSSFWQVWRMDPVFGPLVEALRLQTLPPWAISYTGPADSLMIFQNLPDTTSTP